ncbi:MAG: alginate export family protein [Granulosicoccus sp.]|nr:alginate export family protein [Granulosicoccus sp.]
MKCQPGLSISLICSLLLPFSAAYSQLDDAQQPEEPPVDQQIEQPVTQQAIDKINEADEEQTEEQTEEQVEEQELEPIPSVDEAEQQEESIGRENRTKLESSLKFEYLQREGQDDDQLIRDTGRLRTDLTLQLEQQLSPTAEVVAQMQLRAQHLTEKELRNSPEFDDTSYDLERLYVQQYLANKLLRWRFGRQQIDGIVRSAIDEELDGLRLTIEREALQLDLSFTREDWIEASTAERTDEIYNALVQLSIRPTDKAQWMPYILYRDQEEFITGQDTDEALWYGLQGEVQPSDWFRYWVDLASREGDRLDSGENESLGGFSASIGASWILDQQLNLVLTIGFAHASDEYRQSGLHSNNFRLNDKNRFRYLGEALDPELANIEIITLGLGAELGKKWRGDIALHTYQQVEPEDNIRGSDLEYEPAGIQQDLGSAADIILLYRASNQMDIQATAGYFLPGDAFTQAPDSVWIAGLELEYSF